jgi:hypothetical protein
MKFFTTLVQQTDRTLHNTVTKYETVTLTVEMTSSGDTSRFTSNELITIVMDRLSEVSRDDKCKCGNKDWEPYYIVCGSCKRPISS